MEYVITSVFEVSTNQRIVADSGGNLNQDVEHYYSAFGEVEVYSPSGSSLEASEIENAVLWNSRRYDAQTQLHYYKYRHYQATTGRWSSRDPIEEKGGINLYGFVGNDGVNKWDYFGMFLPGAHDKNPYRPKDVINTAYDAYEHFKSNAGRVVSAGRSIISDIKGSSDYRRNEKAVKESIVEQLKSVACDDKSGSIARFGKLIKIYTGNSAVGAISLDIKDYEVNWTASEFDENCCRTINDTASRSASFIDDYKFEYDPKDSIRTFFSDVISGIIAGDGTNFKIRGSLSDSVRGKAEQCCKKK